MTTMPPSHDVIYSGLLPATKRMPAVNLRASDHGVAMPEAIAK